jgi:hypothetical protein
MTSQQPEPEQEAAVGEPPTLQTAQAGPDQVAAALLAPGQDCAARLTEPWRTADHGALLYDDKGLPR